MINTLSEGVNADNYSASNDTGKKETDNLGSPLKLQKIGYDTLVNIQ
jgi:hypothetical protein